MVHGYLLFGEAYHNFASDRSAIGVQQVWNRVLPVPVNLNRNGHRRNAQSLLSKAFLYHEPSY